MSGNIAYQTRRAGFTLIEAAVTTAIVGTAVLSIMTAQQAFHASTMHAQKMSTALMLAQEVRELTLELPHKDPVWGDHTYGLEWDEYDANLHTSLKNIDDIDDLAYDFWDTGVDFGVRINPPIGALRQPLPDMQRWSQHVIVEHVDPTDVNGWGAPWDSKLMRVTVIVEYREGDLDQSPSPVEVTRVSWMTAGKL